MKVNEIPELAELEKAVRAFDAEYLTRLIRMKPEEIKEITEIGDEGLGFFKEAAKACAPLQNVIIGNQFTLWAIEQWRKDGPLGPTNTI